MMYLQTLNLEWGQIDPKGNRRVKMLQHLTIWNLFRWAFGFMLLTQNWTSSKLFWYLIGNFIWIYIMLSQEPSLGLSPSIFMSDLFLCQITLCQVWFSSWL